MAAKRSEQLQLKAGKQESAIPELFPIEAEIFASSILLINVGAGWLSCFFSHLQPFPRSLVSAGCMVGALTLLTRLNVSTNHAFNQLFACTVCWMWDNCFNQPAINQLMIDNFMRDEFNNNEPDLKPFETPRIKDNVSGEINQSDGWCEDWSLDKYREEEIRRRQLRHFVDTLPDSRSISPDNRALLLKYVYPFLNFEVMRNVITLKKLVGLSRAINQDERKMMREEFKGKLNEMFAHENPLIIGFLEVELDRSNYNLIVCTNAANDARIRAYLDQDRAPAERGDG